MGVKHETTFVEKRNEDHSFQQSDTTLPTTPLIVFFAFFIACGGWLLNFDLSYSGTVLEMQAFKSSFGTCVRESSSGKLVCTLTALQQSLTNISSLFIGVGGLLSGLIGSWLGRRTCIQLGCLIQAIGAAGSMGTAGNFVAYNACKCITGLGLGLLYTTALPYGVELMPPSRRGVMGALFSVGLSLGSNIVAIVCLGSSTLKSDWAWKIPIICEIPIAVFYGTVILLFPESPRWLVLHGREEDASRAFLRMYGDRLTTARADSIVLDVKRNLQTELDLARTTKWTDIFRKHYTGRLFTACLVIVASILCGTFFIHQYAAIFFGQLHVLQNPFALNCIIEACGFPGACAGPFIAEWLGRRRAQQYGYTILGTLMLVTGVVNSCLGSTSLSSVTVLITLLSLWSTAAAAFVTSTAWLLTSELQSVRLRTYGSSFVVSMAFVFQFANNFYTPYMINPDYGNLGVNITYFFLGISVVSLIGVYLLVPETGALSLESLDHHLGSHPRAWTTSLKKNIEIAQELSTADDHTQKVLGTGILEI